MISLINKIKKKDNTFLLYKMKIRKDSFFKYSLYINSRILKNTNTRKLKIQDRF